MGRARRSLLFVLAAVCAAGGTAANGSAPLRPLEAAAEAEAAPARPLPFFYDLYTFRDSGGTTTVVGAFAVEAGRLATRRAGHGAQYRFSVSLMLVDTVSRLVTETHDTVSVRIPHPMRGDHLLYTHVELPSRPSGSTLQRVLMYDAIEPGIGQLYSEPFRIPDYGGSELMLSDIALGRPGADAGWTRGDTALALLPPDLFPSNAFDVYYEIYNLPAGRPYRTAITVDRADEEGVVTGEEPIVRLRFEGESAAGDDRSMAELRRVETSLARGSYRLTVTITDLATGSSATQTRAFRVRGWDRGMTMVPALPQRIGTGL